MNQILHTEKQRIDHLFSLARLLPQEDEILANWARYLCVMSSGLIENTIRMNLIQFISTQSSPYVSKYASRSLEKITNLNIPKIIDLLCRFNSDWGNNLDAYISDEQRDSINSIVANRHNITHGRPVGITLSRIRDYYSNTLTVLDWICEECIYK